MSLKVLEFFYSVEASETLLFCKNKPYVRYQKYLNSLQNVKWCKSLWNYSDTTSLEGFLWLNMLWRQDIVNFHG